MILSKLPNLQEHLEELRELAPSGFVIAINVTLFGPEFLHNEFPDKWREEYESSGFFIFDPVYYWTVMRTGLIRWSEVRYPDPRKVGKKAAKHGLVYGAITCKKSDGRKSFISVARADRELTDAELHRLDEIMKEWAAVVHQRPRLSDVELETLGCIRDGLEHAEIAEQLGVSTSTVKKRLRRIREAFGAETISEAVAIATEKRYFGPL